MDAKITLAFDQEVIEAAKRYAKEQNISLSRLIEYILVQLIDERTHDLSTLPIADWVNQISEGKATYKTRSTGRAKLKDEFRTRKRP